MNVRAYLFPMQVSNFEIVLLLVLEEKIEGLHPVVSLYIPRQPTAPPPPFCFISHKREFLPRLIFIFPFPLGVLSSLLAFFF